jgi:hypothetical protein
VILAHHAGEDLILQLAAGGTSAGSLLLVICRTRLGRLVDRMRRR